MSAKEELIDPNIDFLSVCNDSRQWQKLGDLQDKVTLGQDNRNFLFGTATSTFQDSGAVNCRDSQWAQWEKGCLATDNRSQESANLYQLYKSPKGRFEITERLKKLGVNSYRFSIEWSQIQPNQDAFNEEVLNTYIEFCKHLVDQGIWPVVTLHHFSEPDWFHKLGSFEKEKNIQYFIDFAKKVFPALTQSYKGKNLVQHVCTINEPTIEAFFRYVTGDFSPGGFAQIEKAGIFLKTCLKAHAMAYDVLKKMSPETKVGIVHQRVACVPANPLLYPITRYANRLLNESALNFFKTGNFELKVPFFCNITEVCSLPKTDFVGLQYYYMPLLGLTGSTSYHEPMTQLPFREDPEGLYEAIIQTYDAFKAPIIITENGISTHSDEQRSRYMIRALYAAQRAQTKIGMENLQGYFVWSFCDNFEWHMGLDPQKFGAYALEKIDGKRTLAQDPKPGMDSFIKVTHAWRKLFY